MMRHFQIFLLLFALAVLPVTAVSCSYKEENTPAFSACDVTTTFSIVRRAGAFSTYLRNPSAFIYRDDGRARLEAWQMLDMSADPVTLMSGAGNKIAVVTANLPADKLEFADIGTYADMKRLRLEISREDPSFPFVYGELRYRAGYADNGTLELEPVLAKVRIRSFEVDFSGSAYPDAKLENIRVYLTNVSGIYALGGDGGTVELINQGGYDPVACKSLKHPEMLYSANVKGACLYCYPNTADVIWNGAQDAVFPTRLVIEGSIDGISYYYPIQVGHGRVEKGGSYAYDIVIKRKGTLSPEIDADTNMLRADMDRNPWEEKKYSDEIF